MNIAQSPTSSAKWALSFSGSKELHGPAMHPGTSKGQWLLLLPSPFQSLPLRMRQVLPPLLLLFGHTSSLCHSLRVRPKKMVVREVWEGKEKKRILEVDKGRGSSFPEKFIISFYTKEVMRIIYLMAWKAVHTWCIILFNFHNIPMQYRWQDFYNYLNQFLWKPEKWNVLIMFLGTKKNKASTETQISYSSNTKLFLYCCTLPYKCNDKIFS